MSDVPLDKMKSVDPRAIWPTEPQFSAWLAGHIELLSEALGLEIELVETEVRVGAFSADLSGKVVGSGEEVIIENQLEPTDHAHLGQLLTYAAGREARNIVWISRQLREEHRQAIDWLNLHTGEDFSFFGVELEVWQIGDSLPAPRLNLKAQPSDWQKLIRPRQGMPSELQLLYHEFFLDLLNRLKVKHPEFTTATRVGYDNWQSFGAGKAGFSLAAEFMRPKRFVVQLNVDGPRKEANKLAFDELRRERDEIDRGLGESLEWKRLDNRKMCRIQAWQEGSVDSPPETLDTLKDWAVETLPRFRAIFAPRLAALNLVTELKQE